jgi:uncharacterized protein YdeI (BOF family)
VLLFPNNKEECMNKVTVLALTLVLGFALAAGAYAAQGQSETGAAAGQPSTSTGKTTGSPSQPATGPIISPNTAGHVETIEGQLLRIEKDIYVIKDLTGREVTLKTDKNTKVDGNIAANDQVVARASSIKSKHKASGTWHAESIKKR